MLEVYLNVFPVIAEALAAILALKTRKVPLLLEEAVVGSTKVLKLVAQRVGAHLIEPVTSAVLQLCRHPLTQFSRVRVPLFFLPGPLLLCQCPIVNIPAAAEGLGKHGLLLFGWVYSILIGA